MEETITRLRRILPTGLWERIAVESVSRPEGCKSAAAIWRKHDLEKRYGVRLKAAQKLVRFFEWRHRQKAAGEAANSIAGSENGEQSDVVEKIMERLNCSELSTKDLARLSSALAAHRRIELAEQKHRRDLPENMGNTSLPNLVRQVYGIKVA